MDIKAKIEEIVNKVKGDSGTLEKFKSDPAGTVKGLLGGVDLPTDTINKIVDGVKAKVSLDAVGGAVDKVKGLFGGKK